MKGNIGPVDGAIPSLNHGASSIGSSDKPAWRFSKTRTAHLNNVEAINTCGSIHLSIASEDDLLVKATSGDQQAFDELCRRHSPMAGKRILSIVRNHEDAEDALQETLLRAYMHLGGFRRSAKFSTWLTIIGINTALMVLRKRRIRREEHIEIVDDETGARKAVEYVDPSLNPRRPAFKTSNNSGAQTRSEEAEIAPSLNPRAVLRNGVFVRGIRKDT